MKNQVMTIRLLFRRNHMHFFSERARSCKVQPRFYIDLKITTGCKLNNNKILQISDYKFGTESDCKVW